MFARFEVSGYLPSDQVSVAIAIGGLIVPLSVSTDSTSRHYQLFLLSKKGEDMPKPGIFLGEVPGRLIALYIALAIQMPLI